VSAATAAKKPAKAKPKKWAPARLRRRHRWGPAEKARYRWEETMMMSLRSLIEADSSETEDALVVKAAVIADLAGREYTKRFPEDD
jgi:hypothetical protein